MRGGREGQVGGRKGREGGGMEGREEEGRGGLEPPPPCEILNTPLDRSH